MLYTRQGVRDNIRNREGRRVFYLGEKDRLTPEARDFLRSEAVEILPAEAAAPKGYRLLTGGTVTEKPEHWTHLNSEVLVPKDHPRIAFRGAMDYLEAELLLCAQALPDLSRELSALLDLTRELVRGEVLEEPVRVDTLCGLTEEQVRARSHRPQDYYGLPHFMPMPGDGRELLLLNRARCVARWAELAGVRAFQDREGRPTREDILLALNRMSSMLYLLMLRWKSKRKESGL